MFIFGNFDLVNYQRKSILAKRKMRNLKAFGKWDVEKLEGSPFKQSGCVKVMLTEPVLSLIHDTINERIGFIANRMAGTETFTLPKANRSEEEKAITTYYAVYSPADQWEIKDGGYIPIAGTQADELIAKLIPAEERNKAERAREEKLKVIRESPEIVPYKNFPLSQRQMIEQAAHRAEQNIDMYLDKEIPAHNKRIAYTAFGMDIPRVESA